MRCCLYFDCVILSCSGTLLHDSRSYSNWFISLFVSVCVLCICKCFAVINRCQRILFVCFFFSLSLSSFHSFIHSFVCPFIRLLIPYLSLFHLTLPHSCFACIACFLPWQARCLALIAQSILYSLAPFSFLR